MPDAAAVRGACARALKRSLPVLIGLCAVAGVATAGWFGYQWLLTSDRFDIEAIDVRGTRTLDAEHVRLIAGVSVGDNVFRLDLSDVERAIEADPWVATASVERELPDRLIIDVVERTPAAVVDLGGLYLADAEGLVFKRVAVERGEGAGLPVVTGLDRSDYIEDANAARAAIRRALSIARTYSGGGERPVLGEVHLDARAGVTLTTYETALALRLGRTGDDQLSERLAAFDAAWSALDEDERDAARIVFMDNEINPDRITVRFGGKN